MKWRVAQLLAATGLFLAPEQPPVGEPLEDVAFAGCASVAAGPICRLGEEPRLVLWWPSPRDGAIDVTVDGEPIGVESNPVAGGRQLIVRPPQHAGRLWVHVEPEGVPPLAWSLALAPEPSSEAFDAVAARRGEGDLDGAVSALRPLLEAPDTRARALSQRARIALSRGETQAAVADFAEAITLHERAGELSHVARDGIALSFTQQRMARDFDAAERALSRVAPVLETVAEHLTDLEYQRGALALEVAEPARALLSFENAERWARRLAMDDARMLASEVRSSALMRLGRRSEADTLLAAVADELGPQGGDPCVRAHLLATRAWIRFLDSEASDVPPAALARASASAREAAELHASTCRRASQEADVLVTLALLELRRGRVDTATAALERARDAQPHMPFELESWAIDAQARAAAAHDLQRTASTLYQRLRERAEAAANHHAAWRASWGMAQAAPTAEARITALERAEASLEDELAAVSIGEGRDTLASRRNRTASALVEALHTSGDDAGAMAAARRSLARSLRGLARERRIEGLSGARRSRWRAALAAYRDGRAALDERLAGRWEVPAAELRTFDEELRASSRALQRELDAAYRLLGAEPRAELAAPPADTLLWTAQPLTDGWLLLAQREGEVRAARVSAPPRDPSRIGTWAWGPFDDWIAASERVVVLAPRSVVALDPHAGAWRGAPLLEAREVVYSLDLASGVAPRSSDAVLLVTDPSGNLRGARAEHDALASALGERARGLVGRAATREAVLAALGEVGTLHFAGHGVTDAIRGWDQGIALAGATRLTPADVLASEGAPALVVLSGCETAATTVDATEVQGLGLAPAFLLAGSSTVVATSRPVSDPAAAAFADRLSIHMTRGAVDRRALRAAILELRASFPEEWTSYRVITSDLGG